MEGEESAGVGCGGGADVGGFERDVAGLGGEDVFEEGGFAGLAGSGKDERGELGGGFLEGRNEGAGDEGHGSICNYAL